MGIETRIGIVTGLVIVVIASVYFFYGNNSEQDQFMIATGSKIGDNAKPAEPPKIPANADRFTQQRPATASKPPTVTHTGKPGTVGVPARPSPGAGSPQIASGHPSRPLPSPEKRGGAPAETSAPRLPGPVVHGPPAPTDPRTADGSLSQLARLDEPKRGGGADAADPGTRVSPISSAEPKATPLRTGPSQGLVDATRENIERAQGVSTAGASDSATTQPRGTEPPGRTPVSASVESARPSSPGAHPAAQPQPRQHTIAGGDTLVAVSQKYFGDDRRVAEILAANPQIKDPRRLKIGDVIVIPSSATPPNAGGAAEPRAPTPPARTSLTDKAETAAADNLSGRPSASAAKTYQVKEGDTFYGIAKALYGDGTRWHEIYALNKTAMKNDPRRLRPGMVLSLPE